MPTVAGVACVSFMAYAFTLKDFYMDFFGEQPLWLLLILSILIAMWGLYGYFALFMASRVCCGSHHYVWLIIYVILLFITIVAQVRRPAARARNDGFSCRGARRRIRRHSERC